MESNFYIFVDLLIVVFNALTDQRELNQCYITMFDKTKI